MYKKIISSLKEQGIEFETGLTEREISTIQYIYEIMFPESLRHFLMEGLPVSGVSIIGEILNRIILSS